MRVGSLRGGRNLRRATEAVADTGLGWSAGDAERGGTARDGRGWVSDLDEMGSGAQATGAREIHRVQRGRERAGNYQRQIYFEPPAAPGGGRDDYRRTDYGRETRNPVYPARISLAGRNLRRGVAALREGRTTGEKYSGKRAGFRSGSFCEPRRIHLRRRERFD